MRLAFIGLLTAFSLAAGPLRAAPLDKAACDALKSERDTLVGKGVETDMAKGPEWAKSNVPQERMNEIARMIELDEQLTFRCGRQIIAIPTLKKEPLLPGETVKDKKPASLAVPAATGNTPDTPSAVSIDKPASPAAVQAVPAKPAPKKKAANKKASDAYVPPPVSPGASPDPMTP